MDRRKERESGGTTGQRLLQWMKALDEPRPAGSGAEREAAMYIAKTIRMAGGEPETESFPIWLCEQTAALTVSQAGTAERLFGSVVGRPGVE